MWTPRPVSGDPGLGVRLGIPSLEKSKVVSEKEIVGSGPQRPEGATFLLSPPGT